MNAGIGFMKRNETILNHHKTKVKDIKCHTWVMEENFQAMYDNVYEAMMVEVVVGRNS